LRETKEPKKDILKKPKPSIGDGLHTAARAVVSAVPILGSPAEKIFSLIVAPPIVKRRDEWIESIALGLLKLKEQVQGFNFENLQKNEMFQTTVLYASTLAIRNHQKEKKEALRNAVLNTALATSPDEDLILIFLNYVDVFVPTHLRILKFFDNPLEWAKKHGITFPNWSSGAPAHALEIAFPKLERDFYDSIIKDLHDRGLLDNSIHTGMNAKRMIASRTTAKGKKFLEFISSPLEDRNNWRSK
jgi:hypothetical protein